MMNRIKKWIFSLVGLLGGLSLALNAQEPPEEADRIIGEEVGLVIMGSIVSKTPSKSVVLVKQRSSGRVTAFKIGHSVFRKYPLKEIQKKYIVVEKDKKLVAIYQDKFAGSIKKPKSRPATVAARGGSYSEDGFERNDKGEGEIDVKMTAEYRDNIIKKELATVLMQATATPMIEDGVIIGFELSQIDEGSIYDKGGFKNLDVITAVNGIPLDSVSGAIKLLNSLKQADSVGVELRRGGVNRQMTISVK